MKNNKIELIYFLICLVGGVWISTIAGLGAMVLNKSIIVGLFAASNCSLILGLLIINFFGYRKVMGAYKDGIHR